MTAEKITPAALREAATDSLYGESDTMLRLAADRLESLENDNRELRRKLAELQARLRDRTHEVDEYRADAEAWQDYQYRMACGLRRPK